MRGNTVALAKMELKGISVQTLLHFVLPVEGFTSHSGDFLFNVGVTLIQIVISS